MLQNPRISRVSSHTPQPAAASPEHTLTSDEAFVALRGSAHVELEGEGTFVPPWAA
ncbi:MAG: hypothetical protein ACXWZZ_02865 [Solirubrobacteraceae bacterium]